MPKYRIVWKMRGATKGHSLGMQMYNTDDEAVANITECLAEIPGCSAEIWRPDRMRLVATVGSTEE